MMQPMQISTRARGASTALPGTWDEMFLRSIAVALAVGAFVGCAGRDASRPCVQAPMVPPSASAPVAGDDPTTTDPDKYKAILENENVRVLRYHDAPGQKTHEHQHPASLLYALSDFRRRLAFPDGKIVERDFKSGDVMWLPPQTHTGENIGTTDTNVLLVETKTAPPKTP